MSHASYTTGLREGPAFEYVNRLMQAAGIVFFQRHGSKYLLLIDPFSGFPMYVRMGYIRDTDHTIKQLKRWFATFGMSQYIRSDNGPPFFSKEFCDEYCIELNLTSQYNPRAAECGVGLI